MLLIYWSGMIFAPVMSKNTRISENKKLIEIVRKNRDPLGSFVSSVCSQMFCFVSFVQGALPRAVPRAEQAAEHTSSR